LDALLAQCERSTALAVGPGLGTAGETSPAVRRLVAEASLPIVLDADGLNAFAGRAGELTTRKAPTVLTPHPGELARLPGTTVEVIADDRLAAAREAARVTGSVVVLKGHRTLVAGPSGEAAVNPTGNAGMASGGSGDVLTGTVVALLGQGLSA